MNLLSEIENNIFCHDDKLTLFALKASAIETGGKGYIPPLTLTADWKEKKWLSEYFRG